MSGYMRRFIKDFAKIAKPLFALFNSQGTLNWTEECQKSFDTLKQALTTAPVLVYPDFTKTFILETDASTHGLGAVLSQIQDDSKIPRPIAFASRALRGAYIIGHPVIVITDHIALTSVLNSKNPTPKLHRWILRLQQYDLSFVYRPGASHKIPDALSRTYEPEYIPLKVQHIAESIPVYIHPEFDIGQIESKSMEESLSDIAKAQRKDPFISQLITYMETGILPEVKTSARKVFLLSPYLWIGEYDILYYQAPRDRSEKLFVPEGYFRNQLLFEAHSSKWAGHFNSRSTFAKLAKQYYWPSMLKHVHQFVGSCVRCAIRQGQGRRPKPSLQSIIIEPKPFFCVGMDICKYQENPNTKCCYALVIQDYFTKWPEVYPMSDMKASTIADKWLLFYADHGAPRHVITDQGGQFVSVLMQEVFKLLGTTHLCTTTYHPQCDGMVERFNRSMQNILAKTMETRGHDWDKCLPMILSAYRTLPHSSTNESPFFMLYGYDPVPISDSHFSLALPVSSTEGDDYVTNIKGRVIETWNTAMKSISKSQANQKKQYDKNSSKPHAYAVGDRVWRFLPSVLTGKGRKTANPYVGPFIVTKVAPTHLEIKPTPVFEHLAEPQTVSASQLSPVSSMIDPNIFWNGKVFKPPKKVVNDSSNLDANADVSDLDDASDGIPEKLDFNSDLDESPVPVSNSSPVPILNSSPVPIVNSSVPGLKSSLVPELDDSSVPAPNSSTSNGGILQPHKVLRKITPHKKKRGRKPKRREPVVVPDLTNHVKIKPARLYRACNSRHAGSCINSITPACLNNYSCVHVAEINSLDFHINSINYDFQSVVVPAEPLSVVPTKPLSVVPVETPKSSIPNSSIWRPKSYISNYSFWRPNSSVFNQFLLDISCYVPVLYTSINTVLNEFGRVGVLCNPIKEDNLKSLWGEDFDGEGNALTSQNEVLTRLANTVGKLVATLQNKQSE